MKRWLARHPRFHVYFTPTSSSWSNMVERFFQDLRQNQLRRGIFRDVRDLISAIAKYIALHNQNPKPFVWTAKATDILEKVTDAVVLAAVEHRHRNLTAWPSEKGANANARAEDRSRQTALHCAA